MDYKSGGLLPFPRTGCVPNASVMLTQNDEQERCPIVRLVEVKFALALALVFRDLNHLLGTLTRHYGFPIVFP
jgi:hypothetical protein